jgi:hypothetical protein
MDDRQLQDQTGLRRGVCVRVRVTGHRDRFGIEVDIIERTPPYPAFVDASLIADQPVRPSPEEFPSIGAEMDAVVVAFMPNGELRLDARPSMVSKWVGGGNT